MAMNVAQKLIDAHLAQGRMHPGEPIALSIDQTLTQDATGTMVMLELEAMGLDRVKTEVSAQYVDHNLIQEDNKNPDDHRFLQSAAARLGVWFSRAGNGVSHPTHQQHFGKPGKTLLGSDSHTPAAGSMGMLAIGAGGIDVAMAMAGEPFHLKMPEIWGVKLTNALPDWVSAKDVILEMLRRHGVDGGTGRIIEYYGPGLATLSAMDRHVIANMGAELGATTSVFPADEAVRDFLESVGRRDDFSPLEADEGADYDVHETIDLANVVPLIARPSSPGNVVPVREIAGENLTQAYIGSSANPGYRDFAIAAEMVKGRQVSDWVSFDVNPTSRSILETLTRDGHVLSLLGAGARLHQAGCNGCIGMGQAPANDTNSLRTVPRNFPGRSGTREDRVFLCSPETATASALRGEITDPRDLDFDVPRVGNPSDPIVDTRNLMPPLPQSESSRVQLIKGPNIASLPEFEPIGDDLELSILLKMADDISTDEIMPAGNEVLPYRSNIPRISDFCFGPVDADYVGHAHDSGDHAVIAGRNYGQGSSREHAAIAPRYLGLRVVVAKGFARIHWQNLVNFGVLPLRFDSDADYDALESGQTLRFSGLHQALEDGDTVPAETPNGKVRLRHDLTPRQVEVLLDGGLINWMQRHRDI
ncbi:MULTISPECIES: aconitate hydratase [unclassified Modicisalibacter]|uniref:aconitate hydratase n=1 Tax=unclassified Modicisalibacter TaxID=2679913 RepID=UPI001CCB97EB|nr:MULTISPECIES: aconitate hydratase [unclassified Modicisalibacter]MBZ9560361.1 aconitate hydratase [Modicisalibacter sp. R2A 31.J]MBZ9576270.1 aconitate hydratase [Modicisalibacter sp. MOD 31.J]